MTSTTESPSLLDEARSLETPSDRLRQLTAQDDLPLEIYQALARNTALPSNCLLSLILRGCLEEILRNPITDLEVLQDPSFPKKIGAAVDYLSVVARERTRDYTCDPDTESDARLVSAFHHASGYLSSAEVLPVWIHALVTSSGEISATWHILARNPRVSTTELLSRVPLSTLIFDLRDRGYFREGFKLSFLQRANLPPSFWLEVLQIEIRKDKHAKHAQDRKKTVHLPSVLDRLPTPLPQIPNSVNWSVGISPVQWIRAVSQDERVLDCLDPDTRKYVEDQLRILHRMGIVDPEWKFPACINKTSNTLSIWHRLLGHARSIKSWSLYGWNFATLLDRAIEFKSIELDYILAYHVQACLEEMPTVNALTILNGSEKLTLLRHVGKFAESIRLGKITPAISTKLPDDLVTFSNLADRVEELLASPEDYRWRVSFNFLADTDYEHLPLSERLVLRVGLQSSDMIRPNDTSFFFYPFARNALYHFATSAKLPTTFQERNTLIGELMNLSERRDFTSLLGGFL